MLHPESREELHIVVVGTTAVMKLKVQSWRRGPPPAGKMSTYLFLVCLAGGNYLPV